MPNNISIFILLFLSLSLNAQTLTDLESEKKKINERIYSANKLLDQYSSQRKTNFYSIKVLNNQISDRESLIKIYKQEISLLEEDIIKLRLEISDTESDLDLLKNQYSKLIIESFKNRKVYNEVSFFFGASSFNEAYKRYIMMTEFGRFRHSQGLLIEKKSNQLKESLNLLNIKLQVQNNTLDNITGEKSNLEKDKVALRQNIQKLTKKESELKKEISKQKRALKKLENTIVKMIAEMSKERKEPSNFNLAKGKLPWPLQKGVIISEFGEHPHTVLKYVKVNNNGIDIQSAANFDVKAVFTGKVSRIVSIPGYNKAVIVRHGQFLTVYANLERVNVKNGQTVTNKTLIGKIYSGDGDNSGVLHFEIWKESVKQNPEKWLLK